MLDGAVELEDRFGDGHGPPALFGKADAVFAGNGTAPRKNL